MDTFGSRLKSLRQKKGLTQRELAKLIGAKHNSISDWENDGHKPDMDTIERLMGVFEVSSDYLLARDNPVVFNKDVENVTNRIIEEIAPYINEMDEEDAKLLIEFAKRLKK
jgi:transcriptional regulator with XRE-family HTH domain